MGTKKLEVKTVKAEDAAAAQEVPKDAAAKIILVVLVVLMANV